MFAEAGADGITVHVEAGDTDALIARIRALGCRVGLTLEPGTPFAAVEPFLDRIDTFLVMSVKTGFGGQAFIPEVLDKVRAARAIIDERGLDCEIEIDGGIKAHNAAECAAAGVDILVAGTAVFGAPDPAAAAREIRACAESAR
jgi:ribulose-phosphate 3-epimerase